MTHQPAFPGLILAGGAGRRMGGVDKPLAMLAGRPLVAHVAARFAPQVGALALSANGNPGRFAALGLPVLADGVPGLGPLGGILAGLDWAAGLGAAALATVPADTPFLPADLVARLAAAAGAGGFAIAATSEADRHPTFGLWPVARRPALRAAIDRGERRVGGWAVAEGAAVAVLDDAGAFLNVNTPDDLARAEALAEALASGRAQG